MTTENEPAKLLLPYLQRADELQKHEPLVAYYCRLYAMERGLRIPQKERTKTTNALLVSLMNQLEKDKKSLNLGSDDQLHVEGFALNVFTKADKQDRAGRADLNTAKTFYAASIFFEILNQFGEVQPDLEQKQKYAVWKAADIRKALKDGRKPLPGPPGDKDMSVPSVTSSGEYDLELSRSDSTIRLDSKRIGPSSAIPPDSDSSPQPYDKLNSQHFNNLSPQPPNIIPPSPSSNLSTSPPYPNDRYPPDNFHQPPPSDTSEHPIHPNLYHQPEFQHHSPQHYPSQNIPSFSYPNFRSHPSFTETTLPTAPTHYPSYYQGSDASHSNLPPVHAANYHSSAQYDSVARNGNVPEASQSMTPKYEYDSSYQPPPEQIAEAHKAARFAVGALAFDDVPTAVDHLRKSLELLTKPSAGH